MPENLPDEELAPVAWYGLCVCGNVMATIDILPVRDAKCTKCGETATLDIAPGGIPGRLCAAIFRVMEEVRK